MWSWNLLYSLQYSWPPSCYPCQKYPFQYNNLRQNQNFLSLPCRIFSEIFTSQHFGCMSLCLKSFINANLLHTRKTTVKFSHKMQCSKSSPSLNPVQWICTPHVSNLTNSSFYRTQVCTYSRASLTPCCSQTTEENVSIFKMISYTFNCQVFKI